MTHSKSTTNTNGPPHDKSMPLGLLLTLYGAYGVMGAFALLGQVPALAHVFLTGQWATGEHTVTLVDALSRRDWTVREIVAWGAAALVALVLEAIVAVLLHLAEWRRVWRDEHAIGILIAAFALSSGVATLNYRGHGGGALGWIGAGLSIGAALLFWIVAECKRRDRKPGNSDAPVWDLLRPWRRFGMSLGLVRDPNEDPNAAEARQRSRARKIATWGRRLNGRVLPQEDGKDIQFRRGAYTALIRWRLRWHTDRSDPDIRAMAQEHLAALLDAERGVMKAAVADLSTWHRADLPDDVPTPDGQGVPANVPTLVGRRRHVAAHTRNGQIRPARNAHARRGAEVDIDAVLAAHEQGLAELVRADRLNRYQIQKLCGVGTRPAERILARLKESTTVSEAVASAASPNGHH